jgi:hypothetical protein
VRFPGANEWVAISCFGLYTSCGYYATLRRWNVQLKARLLC